MKDAHRPGQLRLGDRIAKRRLLYPAPLIGAPSVMVLDVPEPNRGAGLALGRYYPIIVETDAELRELEGFLDEPRAALVVPDLLDHRPSQLWSGNVLILRYEPPAHGWPWLCLVRWPASFAEAAAEQGIDMARGCYTMTLFEGSAGLDAHCVALLGTLGADHQLDLRMLSSDRLPPSGNA